MRLLLLNAPPAKRIGVIGQMYPPLGLMYLAAYARERYAQEKGEGAFDVRIIDGYQEGRNDAMEQILAYEPDVLGVSFSTQAATGAYRFIEEMRRHPRGKDLFIICGGPHATALPDDVLRRSQTDIVALGEGEITLYEILQMVEKGERNYKEIPGIGYRKNGEVCFTIPRPLIEDLDTLPFPARDLVDLSRYPGLYYKKEKAETYMTSARGCPFHCTYCSNPVWRCSKPWYRLRSPKNVVDEIEHIVNKLGIKEIYDQTDEFSGNMEWAKAVCDEIVRRGIKVSLKAQMRADRMDEELAAKLRAAGFWMGLIGVESGNDRTLQGIRKRTTCEMNAGALRIMKNAGLTTFALLMAFNVWEEEGKLCLEDKEATLRTLAYVKGLVKEGLVDLMSWSLTTPYPGSELYDIALRHNLIPEAMRGNWEHWDSSERMLMCLPGITNQDWVDVQNKGKRLQAILLFKSGSFNLKSVPMYVRRGISQVSKGIKARFTHA